MWVLQIKKKPTPDKVLAFIGCPQTRADCLARAQAAAQGDDLRQSLTPMVGLPPGGCAEKPGFPWFYRLARNVSISRPTGHPF